MKPGVYFGMPFAEYRAIAAINKSGLDSFARSPLHYWAEHLDPNRVAEEPTPAMRLGSAIHCAVLEPERFREEYVRAPKVDRRTKAGKETWELFTAEVTASGCEVITDEDWVICDRIAQSVMKNPAAEMILEDGKPEMVIIWEDPIEGVLCKARLDWFGSGVILDLKSTQSAHPSAFGRQVANMDWHVQAAWYVDGIERATGEKASFVFGALEKESPFASAFYFAGSDMLDVGRRKYRNRLSMYAECKRTNQWPSYRDEITELRLPAWAMREDNYESTF